MAVILMYRLFWKDGLSATYLMEKNTKQELFNEYARNKRQPSLEDLYKIADILDVNISDLLIANKKENN